MGPMRRNAKWLTRKFRNIQNMVNERTCIIRTEIIDDKQRMYMTLLNNKTNMNYTGWLDQEIKCISKPKMYPGAKEENSHFMIDTGKYQRYVYSKWNKCKEESQSLKNVRTCLNTAWTCYGPNKDGSVSLLMDRDAWKPQVRMFFFGQTALEGLVTSYLELERKQLLITKMSPTVKKMFTAVNDFTKLIVDESVIAACKRSVEAKAEREKAETARAKRQLRRKMKKHFKGRLSNKTVPERILRSQMSARNVASSSAAAFPDNVSEDWTEYPGAAPASLGTHRRSRSGFE